MHYCTLVLLSLTPLQLLPFSCFISFLTGAGATLLDFQSNVREQKNHYCPSEASHSQKLSLHMLTTNIYIIELFFCLNLMTFLLLLGW